MPTPLPTDTIEGILNDESSEPQALSHLTSWILDFVFQAIDWKTIPWKSELPKGKYIP